MNRHQVLWALAKAIGIWLLIGGVLGLIDFAMILVTGDTRVSSGWFLEHPGLGSMLMNGSLRTSIGAYLLYDGSWLIRVTQRSSMAEAPEMPMDSHGLLWALIKVIGIWLLILGILGLAEFVMILVTGDSGLAPGWILEYPGRGTMFVRGFLNFSIGAYMIYDGSWLIRIATRSGMPSASPSEAVSDESSRAG